MSKNSSNIQVGKSWIKWVARRYLKAKKGTRLLNLSSILSMGGIGLGVAAIIIVLSVMNGFEKELRAKLVSTDMHVLITPQKDFPGFELGMIPAAELDAMPAIAALKSNQNLEFYSSILGTELILRAGSKVSGVLMKGVSEEKMKRLKAKTVEEALPQMLVDRDSPDGSRYPGAWIGKELAYELGLIPGDFVTVISPTIMDGPFSNIPRIKRFVVQGIYQNGIPEQEAHEVFTPVANMENFLRRKGYVSQIELTLKNADESSSFIAPYRSTLPNLKIRDWNELNGHLFASMKLERIAMFIILLFTVAIASLNIVSTLTLMVQEKVKEIAILKTLGAKKKDISGIYLWNGIWVGGVGVLWGTVVALVVCLLLKNTEVIKLPEVYYDRTLPVTLEPLYFIGVSVSSFLIVLLASYFPAKRAAELTPLEGIRAY